jgi:translation initiation factor IF-3
MGMTTLVSALPVADANGLGLVEPSKQATRPG